MSTERLDKYGNYMQNIARQAGEIIRSGFDQPLDITIKNDNTPVTPIDKVVDYLISKSIEENFPNHGYLGEETGGNTDAEHFWICDPLDGTKAYINSVPLAAFSMSLVERGEIVSSIIHDPFTQRSVLSAKNEGAWMNGKRLQVSQQNSMQNADIHLSWGDEGYIRRLRSLRTLGAKVIKMDATIYVGMLVSMGKIDGDIFTGNKIWDVAPQSLAVTEAGGKATTLDGLEIVPEEIINGLVVSNGHLHDQILDIIKASRRD